MGHGIGRMSDPLQMSLDEYIAKNRLFINEVPPRRQVKERGKDRLRRGNVTREQNIDPLRLKNRFHSIPERTSRRNGILPRNSSSLTLRGKRVVQEVPRFLVENDLRDRLLRKFHNKSMIEETEEKSTGKLFISNLSDDVTKRDMLDLFSEFGDVISTTVHYSQIGKPLGTADITFANVDDAVEAVKDYNDVPLDGKPMKIELMSTPADLGVEKSKPRMRGGYRESWSERRDRSKGL